MNNDAGVNISVQQFLRQPIVRFAIVGGFNTALTYGVYWFFLTYLDFHYQLALLCEYSVGICVGYLLNRHWTFVAQHQAQQDKTSASFMRYAMTYVGVYLGNAALLSIVVEMGWLSPAIGQLISLVIIAFVSFVMQKYWVFAGRSGDKNL